MFSSKDLFFTPASTGYTVSKSLRFRSSASAYLSRTFGTPTNNKIYTFSLWVKRGKLGAEQDLLNANANSSQFYFSPSDTLNFYDGTSGANYITTQVFRDVSAWYHIVVSQDTTAASNRFLMYVNGVQVTAFSTATAPTQNNSSAFNVASTVHVIGRYNPTTINYLDGYLAEVNFIDGQALTPSSFGAFDTNGVWQPAKYTGSYGTNGFYLKFTDTTSTTTLVADSSGNGNNWTPNNISLTSGTTYDSMLDSPTNATGDIGNYCVLNPLDPTVLTLSSGNLDATYATNSDAYCTSTFRVSSGKWYWEYNITSVGGTYAIVGISSAAAASVALGSTASTYAYISSTGNKYNNGSATAYGNTYTSGAVVAVALDMDNGKLYFGLVSGGTITWQNTGDPVAGTNAAFTSLSGLFTPAINGRNSSNVSLNAGQRPFSASTLPSGFSALNTQNLSTPTITNGAQYMAAVTYNGTSASNTVTATASNSGNNPLPTTFQPDFVWIKSRSAATDHKLTDVVRGTTKALISDTSGAETTDTNGLTAFTSSGFTVGSDTNYNNGTGPATYIAWEWKAGGTGVSNTSGSITSTVSANTSAGFSVVTFTCPASGNFTVGHGLGVAPSMIIVKSRSTAGNNWCVVHSGMTNMAAYFMQLNTTIAQTNNTSIWANTAPTSTVFSMGTNVACSPSDTAVAYCFAPVSAYSAFGSYTGNGSADGSYVYTGFRPRFVLVKNTSVVGDWYIFDTTRSSSSGLNVEDYKLYPSTANAENGLAGETTSTNNMDTLSNGFKLRSANGNTNGSTNVFIYAAFAENPFKISRAR